MSEFVGDHAGDGIGLGDLLALEAFAFEHVEEVGVAAEVELVGAVDLDAAVHEEGGELAVQDGRADLAFDVIAEDGQTGVGEAFAPVFGGGDEDRDAVDEGAARFDDLFHVPFGCHFGADRQEVDDHVGFVSRAGV